MGQFSDHNNEDAEGAFTRPTLDLYLCNKYWNFLTKDLSREEVADLEKAKNQLAHYEKLYTLMEYGSDISQTLVAMENRLTGANPSNPLTLYRNVKFRK